jgi:hypothetical protein
LKIRGNHYNKTRVRAVFILFAVLLGGCALGRGVIRSKIASVTGVPDAGKPATLTSGEVRKGFRIPANSKVLLTRTDATASTPAVESAQFELSEPSEYQETSSRVDASTGTVDTTVRKAQIDAQERRWLLWTAICSAIGGIALRAVVSSWPTIYNGAFALSALSFAAWKFSEIPAWVVFSVVVVAVCLVLGYKKAEWDRNGDGIPDFLQNNK